ncbi:acyltransferase [Roseomonas sp. KE2513]|uniref:acyltransferase family protein n=1 Tax=Roseomonas sp. KE2513 TaxID=2479202 RepID=UPI0018DF3672|nr:acyltransferase [Roseomonas sp. KE2513]MBI0534233.1 acyltransferase [Roseomonas sp. KE2513]
MDAYSIWPFFACMGLLFAFAASPALAMADTPPGQGSNRLAALDGLRAFAAFAVVFHHAIYYRTFLSDREWGGPAVPGFYTLLGHAGVAIFFMVTGYLFWSRLLRESGKPAWLPLYLGRIFRIVPLYLLAVGVMLGVVFLETGDGLNVPLAVLVTQVARWFAFDFLGSPDVNGYPNTSLLLAGVVWTLRYEWIFYLLLPLAALAARDRRMHLPAISLALAVCLAWLVLNPTHWRKIEVVCPTLFLVGMACASLHRLDLRPRLPDGLASCAVLLLLAMTFAGFSSAYDVGPIILLGFAFYLIASGCTVFGLLTSRPARRLGDVSYSIYLLQGLVLAAVLRPAPMRDIALGSPLGYWALLLLCTLLLVAVSTVTYALVERPGIALGRRVVASLPKRPAEEGRAAPAARS